MFLTLHILVDIAAFITRKKILVGLRDTACTKMLSEKNAFSARKDIFNKQTVCAFKVLTEDVQTIILGLVNKVAVVVKKTHAQ